ncbi:hypothetical protein BKA61DRAFT_692712 [Leptodontidium sp. MPI-SDFR-AT-0119]|nr:hypothetical protein BKA61DRAFT_692712 [Leptodontidium sp. MPI-SDFR-AT-0119]
MTFMPCFSLLKIFRSMRPVPTPELGAPGLPTQLPLESAPEPPPHYPAENPSQDSVLEDPPPEYTPLPVNNPIESPDQLQERRIRQRGEELASELYIKRNTKTCPRCLWAMEKTEGCNHMTCHCGHSFCWLCLATWEQTLYQDFHLPTCTLFTRDQAGTVFQFTGRLFPDFVNGSSSRNTVSHQGGGTVGVRSS